MKESQNGFLQFIREKQAHIYPFFDILLNFFNYAFHIFLSWYLLPNDYGVLNAVLSISVVLMVLGISIQTYVARYSAELRGSSGRETSINKALLIWMGLPLMLIIPLLPLILRFTRANYSTFILMILLYAIHVLLSILRGQLQGHERFLVLNTSFYIEVIVKIGALFLLLPKYPRVESAMLSILTGFTAALLYTGLMTKTPKKISKQKISFLELSRNILPIIWANLMLYIFTSVDMLIVNYRFPSESGYFAVTQKYGQLLFFAASSLMTVMFPLLSKYQLPKHAKQFRSTFIKYGLIFIAGLSLALPVYRYLLPLSVQYIFSTVYIQATKYIFLGGISYTLLVIVLFLATVQMAMKRNSYVPLLGIAAISLSIALMIIKKSLIQVYILEITLYSMLAILMSMYTWKETGAMKSYQIEEDSRCTLLFLSWRDICSGKKGGAEIFTHEMLARSDHKKWRIIHFSPEIGDLERKETIDGILYLRKGGIISVIVHAWRFYRNNRNKINFVIDQCNTHRFFTKFWIPARKRVFFIHQLTREIWGIQSSFPVSVLGRIFETALLRLSRMDPAIAVSNSTRDDLIDVGFNPNKVVVFPEGLDFTPWEEEDWKAKIQPRVFLFVGRYAKYKGIDTALKAFLQVKKQYSDLRFWVIGKRDENYIQSNLAPLCMKFTQYAPGWDDFPYNSKGLDSDIVYWGFVSEQEKLQHMSESHLLVFPSIREGWGLIISEAAAVGTPSLVLDAPGTRDAVKGGQCGYICRDNTPESFAEIMIRSLEDKDEYQDFQHKGHAFAKTLHWDRTGEAMNGFFTMLLNKKVT